MRIIDPDSTDEEVEARPRTTRGRPSRTSQAAPRQQQVIDPDETEEEIEVRPPRTRGRPSRASQPPPVAAATTQQPRQRPRQRVREIETIEEEDEANDTVAELPRRHQNRRHAEVVEERPTLVPSRGHHTRRRTEDFIEQPSQSHGNKGDSICTATLATFALSAKGPIKEADLRPILGLGRYKDWQDGLHEINIALSKAFGFTLVYDGVAHLFFLRNDLFEIKSELSEMFEHGTLEQARIDDGTISKRSKPFAEDDFNDDDKKGLLFTILAAIMMSNNVEMGHKNWAVEEEILKHMVVETMGVSAAIFEKLFSCGPKAEYVKDGWLRRKEELISDNNHLYHYSWGPRAVGTVSTSKVFKKFCMINQTPELEWGNYGEILKKLDEKNDLYNPR